MNNGKIERVPVRVGIRGSRNVEIIGDVSRGMAVLSPVRPDLADGTLVKSELNKQAPAPQDDAAPDATPAQPKQHPRFGVGRTSACRDKRQRRRCDDLERDYRAYRFGRQ